MVNVQLLVYDLSRGMASSMSEAILGQRIEGIWHTGVLIFNKEYYYGGGIQIAPLGVFSAANSLHPVQTIMIGDTSKTKAELDAFIASIHSRFTAYTYDLIRNNCNNFSNEVCMFLTGRGIPSFIIDLPNIVFNTPGGAMLRPMIENMQRSAYQQQGHTFDPFSIPSQPSAPQSFESNLSDSIRSSILHSSQIQKAQLEEEPLTSNDSSSLSILCKKIIQLPDKDGVKDAALNDGEKSMIRDVVDAILSHNKDSPAFTSDVYKLLQNILESYPSAQMSLLFLLRLIVLNEKVNLSEMSTIPWLAHRLSKEPESFTSASSLTMALCVFVNILSSTAGIMYIFDNLETVGLPILDVSMALLNHERQEVRQMCAAIAYNFTLANSREGKLSGIWLSGSSSDDLHPTAVQLLLSCVENIGSEEDTIARKRRLAVACRIVRVYGLVAGHLGRDLGFVDSLKALQEKLNSQGGKKAANDYEESILLELSVAFT